MSLLWSKFASLLGPPGPIGPRGFTLDAPQPGERRILLFCAQPLTVRAIAAVLLGGTGPGVTFSLRCGSDVSAAGTAVTASLTATSATTGHRFSDLANAVVPAGCWLWLQVSAVSGAPQGLCVSIEF